jgi:cysteinyl-tRNA synthetase
MTLSLRLHNSLSREIEDFVPINRGRATMYVCGPTVYDTPHVGNARPAVVFDQLYRVLRHIYGDMQVLYGRNYTDIDDKIMNRAAERGVSIRDLTLETIAEYEFITETALGCLKPDVQPRATEAIPEMISMIQVLVGQGNAYEVEGHVFFDVPSYPRHGLLSGHAQEDLRAGSRVDPSPLKRDQSDFVLWKPSSDDQPGWDSPWGRGRPGWHIECSAMIASYLGSTIDIHGGGGDLRFPHHDCEISQSACANKAPLARYFLHNGMVRLEGRKMNKTQAHFATVRDALAQGIPGDAVRLALLSAHYRQPLDWDEDVLMRSEQVLGRWRNALVPFKGRVAPECTPAVEPVLEALASDLNTPLAITRMHELAGQVNRDADPAVIAGMMFGAQMLGVLPDLFEAVSPEALEIQALVDQRMAARKAKDFSLADRLRANLEARGIALRDDATETIWWKL